MRIINVVTIRDNILDNIESFAIYEDQLSNDVVKEAENYFIKKAEELGFLGNDFDADDDLIDSGYFENDTNESVCISWSSV